MATFLTLTILSERDMEPEFNPYASPQMASEPPLKTRHVTGAVKPYLSGHGRAVFARAMFVFTMVLACLAMGSTYLQISLLDKVKLGFQISQGDANANDARQVLVAMAQLAVGIATAVAFLMWFHRVHRNLPSLGAKGLQYTTGWTIGGFCVPFLNLVRPYQVMSEVWRGSDPSPKSITEGFIQRVPVSSLLGWWWALYLLMNISAQISASLGKSAVPGGVDIIIASSWTAIVSDLIAIPAALAAIYLVSRIDANQTARYEAIVAMPESEPLRKLDESIPEWLR